MSDYLIFSMIFVAASVSQFSVFLYNEGEFFMRVIIDFTFVLVVYALFEIASRTRGKMYRFTPITRNIIALLVLTCMVLIDYLNINFIDPDITSLRIVISDLYRLFVGIILYQTFAQLKLTAPSKRSKTVKLFWRIISILLIFISGLRVIFHSLLSAFILSGTLYFNQYVSVVALIVDLTIFVIAVMTSVLGVFFPELMLISSHTILQTNQIYNLLDDNEISQKSNSLFEQLDPKETIIGYLELIKDDVRNSQK